MCAIFGVLDYRGRIAPSQRLQMVKELGKAAEVRGTDATGIAFFAWNRLFIQKAPKPAHKMKYRIPAEAKYIMGHTRMTTQGDPRKNQNNHPFAGQAGGQRFALAHNGVIYNDELLQESEHLPRTAIETDSYVAVQLIEKQGGVSFDSLKAMAEALEGNFTFTVLAQDNDLYFVKGNNPLTLYHYPKMGVYLYASTAAILDTAAKALGIQKARHESIQLQQGDILRIDKYGHRDQSVFDDRNLVIGWYDPYSLLRQRPVTVKAPKDDGYISALKAVAWSYGFEPAEIDRMLAHGFQPEEIEEFLYGGGSDLCEY